MQSSPGRKVAPACSVFWEFAINDSQLVLRRLLSGPGGKQGIYNEKPTRPPCLLWSAGGRAQGEAAGKEANRENQQETFRDDESWLVAFLIDWVA